MPNHTDCLHEEDFKRLEKLVEKVFGKMDDFVDEMREVMISEAARGEQVKGIVKDLNAIGEKYRTLSVKMQDLSDWRQRFEGGIKVMMAIPVFCTVITTGIAIYKMMQA